MPFIDVKDYQKILRLNKILCFILMFLNDYDYDYDMNFFEYVFTSNVK